MGYPVVHFEISAKDTQRMHDFYARVFEWQINADNPWNYGLVHTNGEGGIDGGIFQAEDDSRRVTIYVQVPDLQASLDRAEQLGGRTLMPPTEIPGAVTMAMFSDPEGNIVGLVKG